MDAVNSAMTKLFDLAWSPFSTLAPWIGLFVFGVLFGVIALIAMKYTTNPKRVERLKDRSQGHILAIKLFRDSFTVVVGSLLKTLAWSGAYLTEQFKPMLVMLIPFVLLFAQMQMRLGFRPLDVGKTTLVTVELDPQKAAADLDVRLDLPAGVELAKDSHGRPIPLVHEPSQHRIAAAVVPTAAGAHAMRFTAHGETVTKTLHAGAVDGSDRVPMVSTVRSQSWSDRLLFPGEASFGAGSVFSKIELHYPVRPLTVLGLDLSFGSEYGLMIVFVLITIVAAFALKGLFGVTI